MNSTVCRYIISSIASRLGFAVVADCDDTYHGISVTVSPEEPHPNETFSVEFRVRETRAEAVFRPGRFASAFVRAMGRADAERREAFAAFANALEARRILAAMKINGVPFSTVRTAEWPNEWRSLDLVIHTRPHSIDLTDEPGILELVDNLVVAMFGMVLALVGEGEVPESIGVAEGRSMYYQATRYERKAVNRQACIALKGTKCVVCGFDFHEFYGPIGRGVVEVHHVIPLASLEREYKFNIRTDLEPVCSNCHTMLHRQSPPISIEQLRDMMPDRHSMGTDHE